jgi:hypothetical protein
MIPRVQIWLRRYAFVCQRPPLHQGIPFVGSYFHGLLLSNFRQSSSTMAGRPCSCMNGR